MRPRWFVVVAVAALVLGTVIGWTLLRDDGSGHVAADRTTTTTLSTTTTSTVPLTSSAVLTAELLTASKRLTGANPSTEDISAFVAGYHQDELAHHAADPASAADAYVRLHHPAEVTAYGYVRQAKCFGERLIPGGDDADCDEATTGG